MPVRILPEAFRQIERLPPVIHRRVLDVLERLTRWPNVSGAKPLRGDLAGHYRIRTGEQDQPGDERLPVLRAKTGKQTAHGAASVAG